MTKTALSAEMNSFKQVFKIDFGERDRQTDVDFCSSVVFIGCLLYVP